MSVSFGEPQPESESGSLFGDDGDRHPCRHGRLPEERCVYCEEPDHHDIDAAVAADTRAEQRFRDFHTDNPNVYYELRKLAIELVDRGHYKLGIGMLFEVLRWQRMMTTNDPHSDFKLNNNYRSHYARLLMLNEPELIDKFEIRELRAS